MNFVFILQGKIIFFKKSSIIQIISTKFANTNCSEVFTFSNRKKQLGIFFNHEFHELNEFQFLIILNFSN